jgi:Biopolymer transport protein ExbD/TolR
LAFAASKRKMQTTSRIKPFTSLKLTSLIDMFTIILVFLLKSYSVVELNVQVQDNLHLPNSVSRKLPMETVVLTIAKNVILIDGIAVAQVGENFEVAGVEASDAGVPAVTTLLSRKFKAFERQAQARQEKFKGELTVQCDKEIPYRLLKRLIKSAGDAHFSDFKLMAFKVES